MFEEILAKLDQLFLLLLCKRHLAFLCNFKCRFRPNFGFFQFWLSYNMLLVNNSTTIKPILPKIWTKHVLKVTQRLDGVYSIIVIAANLVLRISLQISNDVHFFSFLSHSTNRKERFEPL